MSLPYIFDLLWDIKTLEEAHEVITRNSNKSIEVCKMLVDNNLPLPTEYRCPINTWVECTFLNYTEMFDTVGLDHGDIIVLRSTNAYHVTKLLNSCDGNLECDTFGEVSPYKITGFMILERQSEA